MQAMTDAFSACHAVTHQWERGYVNHPADPGGATLNGVTQAVYDGYRRRCGRPQQHVRHMSKAEELEIYRRQYWNRVRAEHLTPGIDLVVYDLAVNSGPDRAIRYLQAALGVKQDGEIGEATLAAVREAYDRDDDDAVIQRIMDARNRFLRGLKTFRVFGKGWMNRTRDVEARAKRMEVVEDRARTFVERGKRTKPAAPPDPALPEVYRPDKATSKPDDPVIDADRAVKTGGALIGIGAILKAVQETIDGVKQTIDGVIPSGSAIAVAIIVVAAGVSLFHGWQRWRDADLDITIEPQGDGHEISQ